MLQFGATDITVIFGLRGSGKSTLGRAVHSAYRRRVVIDPLQEWNNGTPSASFEEFAANFSRDLHAPECLHVYQSDVEKRADESAAEISQVLRLCYKSGRITGKNLAILVEEAHLLATPVSIDHWLFQLVMTGRHANTALICSTQRPASLHKGIISQASHVLVGQLFERRDIEYLASCIGEAAFQAESLEKHDFLHYQPGQPVSIIKGNSFRSFLDV